MSAGEGVAEEQRHLPQAGKEWAAGVEERVQNRSVHRAAAAGAGNPVAADLPLWEVRAGVLIEAPSRVFLRWKISETHRNPGNKARRA